MKVLAAQTTEPKVSVKTIKVGGGQCFRLPDSTFEEAVAADDAPHFYIVTKETKDGLVTVVGVDGRGERKLPEETLVILHHYEVHINPAAK